MAAGVKAVDLIAELLGDAEKFIAVTGATGWLGSVALDLLYEALGDQAPARVVAYASSAREVVVADGRVVAVRPLVDLVAQVPAPTTLLDFATGLGRRVHPEPERQRPPDPGAHRAGRGRRYQHQRHGLGASVQGRPGPLGAGERRPPVQPAADPLPLATAALDGFREVGLPSSTTSTASATSPATASAT